MFKTEVKGRYTLIRRKADGTPVETLEFDNIITNAGLDWIAAMDTDLMGEPVAVSTSTADPNPSAPAIPEVVQRTSASAPGGGTSSGLDGEWLFWRKRWRFPQGTLAGQVLATVGLICNSDRRFESNTGELIPKVPRCRTLASRTPPGSLPPWWWPLTRFWMSSTSSAAGP
uniref:Tail fiber protein n=1 Tax=Pseudomonas phage vB_PaPhi_Mx1 TaxID=3079664 RepID=A0AAU0N545_9CAUD